MLPLMTLDVHERLRDAVRRIATAKRIGWLVVAGALALAAAMVIEGRDDVCFLSAGTDGTDGPGEDAGVLVDGGTLGRGRQDGFDAVDCLARADSGSLLQASGDLIHTGPTGTNVMDLMLGLKLDGAQMKSE